MSGGSVKIEGARELVAALQDLGKSTGKNVLRRVGRKRLEPMRDAAAAKIRERSGAAKRSIKVGTKLAKSQRAARGVHVGGGQFRADPKNDVTIYMGPGQNPEAITEEFGTFNQEPHPYMRPAFDSEAQGVVDGIADDLWVEIRKAAARAAKKAAKLLAKAG